MDEWLSKNIKGLIFGDFVSILNEEFNNFFIINEDADIITNLDNLEKKLLETCNLTENMKIYIEYYRSLA